MRIPSSIGFIFLPLWNYPGFFTVEGNVLSTPRLGEDIKDYVKKTIRNILYSNIDVHSRRLIYEFPGYGVKCISKIQSHCANMTFVDKSRYGRFFQQGTNKGGGSALKYIKIFSSRQALSVSVGHSYSEDQFMHIFLDNFHRGGNILHK